MSENTTKKQIAVTKNDDSTVKIEGELPFAHLEKHRKRSIETLGKDVSIDGFRKGHIPENVLVKHVGEMAVLTDMAERALSDAYPEILKEHEIDAIGRPEIGITKIAEGNPLGFTATVAVMPKVTLPDYKTLAKEQNTKKESDEVTNPEVEEAIEKIQRQKLSYDRIQEKAKQKAEAEEAAKKAGDDGLTLPTPESVSKKDEDPEEVDHSKEPVPELTDEYVKTLGNFETVEDFKKKIRSHLENEKKAEVLGKHRAAVTDAIIEKSEIKLPQIMIDSEMGQMFGQMEEDLKRANLTMDNYLEHIKKTREDLQKEWTPAAEKRAKTQLILNEIAKIENITPDKEKVDAEVKHLLEHYKDADEVRVRIYVESMLRNEKVMEFLESQ